MTFNSIGFTGTGLTGGLTPAAKKTLVFLLRSLYQTFKFSTAHHGDCVEADAYFDYAIKNFIDPKVSIHIHPGFKGDGTFFKRAFCKPRPQDVLYEPHPFLDRNQHIVDGSELLVATPDTDEASGVRKGEWHTVRRARQKVIPVFIVWPDGTLKMDRDQFLNVFNQVFQNIPTICK